MRNFFTLMIAVLITTTVWAQSPQKMSYQAVIRDATNHLVVTQIGMQVSVLQGSSIGTPVYVETQTPTPNSNGLVTIEIGNGTPVAGTFTAINWADGPYYIKTETDPSGPGTSYTIEGVSQLLSVPYALYAKNGFTHYIGELFGGGIIVAVWSVSGVEHGLIASLTDIGVSYWSNLSTLIGPTAQGPIDGQANTTAIITQSGHTDGAALLCDTYSSGIYDDWYLPASWELNLCYNAAIVINSILGSTDGFKLETYWSSSEASGSGTNAYAFLFNTGYLNYLPKSTLYRVRAVRRF